MRIKSPRGLRGGESALCSKRLILIGLPLWPELLGRRLQAADRTRPKLKLCSPPLRSTWSPYLTKGGFMLLIYDYEKQHFAP